MVQTAVEMVKPGGTGRPALVISARPEPFPPRRSFMLRLPSAFPFPKKYTYLVEAEDRDLRFTGDFFAMDAGSVTTSVIWWLVDSDSGVRAVNCSARVPVFRVPVCRGRIAEGAWSGPFRGQRRDVAELRDPVAHFREQCEPGLL